VILCANITAGHPDTGGGYVVPSYQLFRDVERTLDDTLLLLSVGTVGTQPNKSIEAKDYYTILGVDENAPSSRIKMAYDTALFVSYHDSNSVDENPKETFEVI
jgi:hypothetical protein